MRAEDKRFLREFVEWFLMLAALSAFMFFAGMRYEQQRQAEDIVVKKQSTR